MEQKDYIYLTIIALSIISGITYNVYDLDQESVCRTGDGWTVVQDYGTYSEAECRYTSREWDYANCSSFRATATRSRYGCNEVEIVLEEATPNINYQQTGMQYTCPPGNRGCFCKNNCK